MPSESPADLSERKAAHLEICLDERQYSVESGNAGYGGVHLVHRSLPEIAVDEVVTSHDFLGHRVAWPFFISSMTGGSENAYAVNRNLAKAAQELSIPVGMGSIRILFHKPDVIDHFLLKRDAPGVPVFANIGGVQLPQMEHGEIYRMVERVGADAIAVHLNPGQEIFQPGGDRDFRGILDAIARFCRNAPFPVIVKETGFGIHPDEVHVLFDSGATYVDLAGSGGTNWVTVEAYRHEEMRAAADEFVRWGTPTAVLQAALGRDRRGVLASGGVRSGLDVVKALALGAESAGMALPFVRALTRDGVEGAVSFGRRIGQVVKAAMVLTGARTVDDLRTVPLVMGRELTARAVMLRDITINEERESDG